MFLLLFIFILSPLSLSLSLSSLHLFVCAHFTACPARLGSSFVVVVAIVLTLSLRQVSNVAEWPTPSSSSFTVAGSFLPLPHHPLHTLLCPLFRGVYLRWRQSVSSPGVAPAYVLPLSLSTSPSPTSTLSYFATFSVCFALFAASAPPLNALPCGSLASSAHKFYLYIFRYFPTAFVVVVVHIL